MAVWETASYLVPPQVYGAGGSPSFWAARATRSDEGVGALIRLGDLGGCAPLADQAPVWCRDRTPGAVLPHIPARRPFPRVGGPHK